MITIVSTTIFHPIYITNYINSIMNAEEEDKITFIVVGDHKTPPMITDMLNDDYTDCGIAIEYWSPKDQERWLMDNLKLPSKAINMIMPENSPRRRNFGYLRAMDLKSDYTIVVDDDNHPLNSKWLDEHIAVLKGEGAFEITSKNNIVNPCSLLSSDRKVLYARGFPIDRCFGESFDRTGVTRNDSVINTALWLEDPDIDASIHLLYDNIKCRFSEPENFALSNSSFMPINSQNTAFKKEVSPVYWNIHMPKFKDLDTDRYDDIWGGLFALKCIKQKGKTATFGSPIVLHSRNSHNYISDFRKEFTGMSLNSRVYDFLMNSSFAGGDYLQMYECLAMALPEMLNINSEARAYFREISLSMMYWIEAVEQII